MDSEISDRAGPGFPTEQPPVQSPVRLACTARNRAILGRSGAACRVCCSLCLSLCWSLCAIVPWSRAWFCKPTDRLARFVRVHSLFADGVADEKKASHDRLHDLISSGVTYMPSSPRAAFIHSTMCCSCAGGIPSDSDSFERSCCCSSLSPWFAAAGRWLGDARTAAEESTIAARLNRCTVRGVQKGHGGTPLLLGVSTEHARSR
mmetsp:Transcript_11560/g.24511  ORF Transcript_11560/g.24511 Transcript_11560/m.24511 type:complete len:205 (-) Transcript_11560:963-1577(-)